MQIFARIKSRRDTLANWTSENPVLAAGEISVELVTFKLKIGDGVTAWNALPYFSTGVGVAYQAVAADTVIADGDTTLTVAVTTGALDRTITLPDAANNTARHIAVGKVDAGAGKVIIDGNGAQLINGDLTAEVTVQFSFLTLVSTGAGWLIV